MEAKETKREMLKILIYVGFSVGGLILLKIGTSNQFELGITNGVFNLKINIYLLLGMLLYIMSFVTSLIAMKSMNLSFFYPVSAGLGYVCVCILSYFVLKESISLRQLIGMSLILVGVIIMNIRKA